MDYKFNYTDYAERYYELDNKESYSSPLKYYPYKNIADLLFPESVSYLYFNNNQRQNRLAENILRSKGISFHKIIALFGGGLDDCITLDNSIVYMDKINGNVMAFNCPIAKTEPTFINSSIEQFAECGLFYKEYLLNADRNLDSLICKRDTAPIQDIFVEPHEIFEIDSITADIVLEFLDKIESIDSGADKEDNYWNSLLSFQISEHEAYKMVTLKRVIAEDGYMSSSISECPSILDLPAWKILHPRYSKKERNKILAKKNPAIAKLSKKFDLKIDCEISPLESSSTPDFNLN